MMDSSTGLPESPMEQDDPAYPCKGCGEVRPPTPLSCFSPSPSDVGLDANDIRLY